MNKLPLAQFYAENDKLVHFATLKAIKRFKSAGLENYVEYDEIHARLTEVFIKSYNGFDPERANFSTYFVTAATNYTTSMIEDLYRMDIRTDSTSAYASDDEDSSYDRMDEVFQVDPMVDREVEVQDTIRFVSENLSPLAKILFEYSVNPPEFIQQEFKAQRAQSEFARTVGQRTFHSLSLDMKFVANCLRDTVDSPSELNFIENAVNEVKNAVKSAMRA